MNTALQQDLSTFVQAHRDRLTEIVSELVRRPSENKAPYGSERDCQEFAWRLLRDCGADVALYEPDSVPGITEHPLYWAGRKYADRPNLSAHIRGAGGGHSLILSGHIDTVPIGAEPWIHDPFGAVVEGNRRMDAAQTI